MRRTSRAYGTRVRSIDDILSSGSLHGTSPRKLFIMTVSTGCEGCCWLISGVLGLPGNHLEQSKAGSMQVSRNKGMPQIPKRKCWHSQRSWGSAGNSKLKVEITALSLVEESRGSAHAVQADLGVLSVLLLRYATTNNGRMIRSMVSLLTRVYSMF
jgi:hypothetical protein